MGIYQLQLMDLLCKGIGKPEKPVRSVRLTAQERIKRMEEAKKDGQKSKQ